MNNIECALSEHVNDSNDEASHLGEYVRVVVINVHRVEQWQNDRPSTEKRYELQDLETKHLKLRRG